MNDIVSWDKAIDKKVKSSDGKDIGKVRSITRDYIQTKEGVVSKNYYYIPKYYLTGYDGSSLWVSLTKDEVKSRFEGEKEPEIKQWETAEYIERRKTMASRYPDFETSIPQYEQRAAEEGIPLPWERIIGKEVKSSDGKDLGKVHSLSSDYIEAEEGVMSKKYYYIPKYYIEGYDGDKLYAALSKDRIKELYERDNPPDLHEFQSADYLERVRSVQSQHPQFLHGVPCMAREPSTKIPVDYSGTTYNIPWHEIIHKQVRTSDGVQVGYVEHIGDEYLAVRQEVGEAKTYYIPKTYIREYDGSQLRVDAPSNFVESTFVRDREPTLEETRALARESPRHRRKTEEPAQRTAAEPDKVSIEHDVELDKIES